MQRPIGVRVWTYAKKKTTKKECAKKYDKLLRFNIIVLIVRVRSCEINSGSCLIAWISDGKHWNTYTPEN